MKTETGRRTQQDRARAEIRALRGTLAASVDANAAWTRDVTAIIKTFERPYCVSRLLGSIRNFFPDLPVLVCDDSRETLFADGEEPIPGVRWLTLPADAGHTLGAGRNCLVDRAQTGYVFLCDDDHEFVPQTRLHAMWDFLEQSGFDIVGGAQGADDYGTAVFEEDGDRLLQVFYKHHGLVAEGVVACDRVSNTFLARTAALRRVRWEERVYAHEHADFFVSAKKAGLRVAQMGRTYVEHDRDVEPASDWRGRLLGRIVGHRDSNYRIQRMGGLPGDSERAARRRAEELYRKHVLEKHGVSEIRDQTSGRRRRELEALIGRPGDPAPS